MPASKSPNPLEAHLGFWLRFVSNQVSGRFEKLLDETGITLSEWVALRTLYEGSTNTHSTLIDALGMTKGAASKIITRLEDKKLVERRLAEDKAREQVLTLTDSGRVLLPKLAALADANDHFFFGHLSESQSNQLMTLMQDLVRHHKLKEIPIK